MEKYFNIIIIIMIIITLILYYFKLSETFKSDKKIGIVYFAFLKEDKWRTIVLPQMHDLVNCELAENADINIVLSGSEKEISSAKTEITNILSPVNTNIQFDYSYENTYEYPGIKKLYEKAISSAKTEITNILSPVNTNIQFDYSYENTYEYPGIKKLYEKAIEDPRKIYLYFHSKGMVFHEGENKRNELETYLFKTVITNWKHIINIFIENPDKNKVSLGSPIEGFCWYNFFWIRGNYLKKNCSPPIISDNRYYYESYLAEACKNASYEDCYNLANNNDKPYYTHADIMAYVMNLNLI